MALIRLFRHPFIPNSLWFRRLILPFLLLLDSYFGLSYGAGIISWTGLFTGDIKWFMLAVEMLVGALLIIRLILNQTNPKWRTAIIVSVPILVVLISFEILEVVLSGLGRSSTMNFNLSSIGLSGLYWSAVYLSIAIGLTLTYKVQRFANFAQAEMMLVGSYVALTLMWSDRFFQVSDAPKDGVLNW